MSQLDDLVAQLASATTAAFGEVQQRLVALETATVIPPEPPEPPEPEPGGKFGAAYADKPSRPNGEQLTATTKSQLTNQWNTAPDGARINYTGPTISGGLTLSSARRRLLTGLKHTGGQLILSGTGAWLEGCDLSGSDGCKVSGADHVLENNTFHDTLNQAVNQQDAASNLWVVGNRFNRCGVAGTEPANQRHALYLNGVQKARVLNNEFDGTQAYAVQIGDKPTSDVIVACNTMIGGVTRSGIIVWGNAAGVTAVGNIIRDSPQGALACEDWGNNGGGFYDTITYRTGGMSVSKNIHPSTSNPDQVAKGYVPEERWQYVPATDIDGNSRVSADAGCAALAGGKKGDA